MKKKVSISDKALKLINNKQIKPIPKWEFVVKSLGLWLEFIICLILLVLGIGITWFGLVDNIIIPYLWLFIAVVFLILSFLLFEKTKKAYRFQRWQVIALIVVVGITIGGVIFKMGLAGKADRHFESRFGFYRKIVPMKMIVWNNPMQGYLSGEITFITDTNNFKIKDFNGNIWTIISQNPIIRSKVKMLVGEEIKLIGTKTGNNSFAAQEVRPWNGKGKNMMKENH